jgi:AcrR family transcriptional regulator
MEDLRELILDKAQSRFDRFGFQKTTMDEISRDCSISKKTLYGLFLDKQNLFDCLFVRESHRAIDTIFKRMGEVPDPLDRLIQLLKTSIAYFSEENFLTRLLKNDDALFSALMNGRYHCRITDHLIDIIVGIMSEGKIKGRIRPDVDEKVAAYIGLRLFEAFSYMRTISFDTEKEKQGYYTDALVDFFVHALAAKQ